MRRTTLVVLVATLVVLASPAGLAAADKYDEASKLFKQGNLSAALDKVEPIITANPRDARARFLKGLILTEQNKPQDAIKIFSQLTEDYPELPEPYNNLAVLHASQGQYDKARKSLEMAIRTHPSYAIAHENLGDVYAKMASEAYDKALQLDRENAAAQTKLAMIKDLFTGSVVPGRPEVLVATTESKVQAVGKAPVESQPKAVGDSAPKTPAPPAADPAEKKPSGDAAKSDASDVMATVDAWAKAWSLRDAAAYLSHYAPEFQVPGGEARAAWEATRRDRITKPKSIEVTVVSPKVQFENNGQAQVKFRQVYKSDTLNTSGAKTLTLVKAKDRWQIVQERMN
ncbi:MAG: tetratricopeptide repeat protein [Burkholderiales bacterium]